MSDYISREALIDRLNKNLSACNHGTFSEMCYSDAIETVKHFPAADVEPVRRGRWVVDYPDGTIYEGAALRLMFALITCSECGKTFELAKIGKARYCTCGSKMDLEEQNEP